MSMRNEEDPSNKPKLETTPESSEFSATFVLNEEDHTIGNALRYALNQNPKVTFCGYSVPHPLENSLHLHIQTKGIGAWEALKEALRDIKHMCEHVNTTFEEEENDYYRRGGTGH